MLTLAYVNILSPKEKVANFVFMAMIYLEFITFYLIMPVLAMNDFAVCP
jgi:hypothetical protein